MSDDSIIASCCGACFGIFCLGCCESILVSLNFKKPGSRAGTTQRGCCRNLGEATEDDVFEENARKQRAADSPKEHRNGSEDKSGRESGQGEGGDGPVSEQPAASPAMNAATPTAVTKPDTDEAK